MKFTDLNPLLSGSSEVPGFTDCHQLTMDCPVCRNQIVIYVHLNGREDMSRSIWQLTVNPDASGWDSATILPSIQMHPVSRKQPACPGHWTVAGGEVVLH